MRAARILRQVVRARIMAQVPGLPVFDRATEDQAYPYATLGASDWSDESVECVQARRITLQVDVWHSRSNKGVLEDYVDDVTTALNGWADTESLTMAPLRLGIIRVFDDPDGASVHGVVQVDAIVEA